jgi:MerR family transcriptional regulator, light-induced transcriptional regulator
MEKMSSTYKIRQVIELTGVSEFLLRVWEDRYLAFAPLRSETGRRLYSETDILKARALHTLTQKGNRIGDIAQLSLPQLNRLLDQGAEKSLIKVGDEIKKIIQLAHQFAWEEVRTRLSKKKKQLKPLEWIHQWIVPLLAELGRQVESGDFTIAEEHILSALLKEHLVSHYRRKSPHKKTPRIVFATPEGDYHDLGILVAAFMAQEMGANTLFLGPHVPKRELVPVCLRYHATHLLLTSTTIQEADPKKVGTKEDYFSYLNFLDRNLNPKTTIWLAGRNSIKYAAQLNRPFRLFQSFKSYEEELLSCFK